MMPSMAHVILPFLVAMAAAAPLADKGSNGEQVVNIRGDNEVVDRAKRAKEQIVFGNQQNGGSLGAAKKSLPMPLFLHEQGPQAQFFSEPQNQDKTGYMFAEAQKPVPAQEAVVNKEPAENPFQPIAIEGGETKPVADTDKEEVKVEEEEGSQKVPVIPVMPVEGGSDSTENAETEQQEAEQPTAQEKEAEHESDNTDSSKSSYSENQVPVEPSPVEPVNVLTSVDSNPPLDSQNADAEEAIGGQDQTQDGQNSDDVESFLKELTENNAAQASGEEKEEEKEKEEEEEGSAEAELMQVANQNNGNNDDVMDTDSDEYTQKLLKYILMHGDDYGRMPVNYGYQYPGSYFLQRRRRSLARHRLPRLHRRRNNKQLARSKRTKRDLFDDDLYYPSQEEPRGFEENPEDAERQADMEELIAYLMALYPNLYENQAPRQEGPYPGYMWYGNGNAYPEEGYPEYMEWEEPEYMEVPAGWEPSQPQVPAWEPAFYPEELEDPDDFYPAPAKRQMLSMVPGNRRKRYFYPFAREPYTHWGAFVPSQEKRDYDDAYWRLKKLAMVLAESPQSSPYIEALDDYKKK